MHGQLRQWKHSNGWYKKQSDKTKRKKVFYLYICFAVSIYLNSYCDRDEILIWVECVKIKHSLIKSIYFFTEQTDAMFLQCIERKSVCLTNKLIYKQFFVFFLYFISHSPEICWTLYLPFILKIWIKIAS